MTAKCDFIAFKDFAKFVAENTLLSHHFWTRTQHINDFFP